MPRGGREPSKVFGGVLKEAADELTLASLKAKKFHHKGVRGDERAGALIQFLSQHLPGDFGIRTGEAIDYLDARTGQLDIMIYDKSASAPVSVGNNNLLLPCESLYSVIEVKTTLTQNELNTAYEAATKVRQLRPFKSKFVGPRPKGVAADENAYRCLYAVFAYRTNLGETGWLKKEYARVEKAAIRSGAPLDSIERIIVLDRGMINPGPGVGKSTGVSGESIFLEFYVHLMNFLNRERSRRQPVDWQVYSARTAPGWDKIK